MLVKNKKSGEMESLRYGAAVDAVAAGTHEIVNEGEDGKAKTEKSKAKPDSSAKQA